MPIMAPVFPQILGPNKRYEFDTRTSKLVYFVDGRQYELIPDNIDGYQRHRQLLYLASKHRTKIWDLTALMMRIGQGFDDLPRAMKEVMEIKPSGQDGKERVKKEQEFIQKDREFVRKILIDINSNRRTAVHHTCRG